MQHLCSVNPRLRFKFVGLTVVLTASVADNQWAASPRLSESSIWRGKRSGRDIRAHRLSLLRRLSSDPTTSQAYFQTSTGFGTGAEPRPPRSTIRSGTAWNNVADRVGKFPSLRLILPSRPEETGGTRQSQSRGNTVLLVEKIFINVYCEAEVIDTSLFSTFNNCVNKWF